MEIVIYTLLGLVIALFGANILSRRIGFLAQMPNDYADTGPDFDIRERLNGHIKCEGMIYGPTGRVSSRFVADFEASWTGDTGIMKEVFHYDSGAVQHREWTLRLQPDGTIKADAPDLVGTGSGQQTGPTVQLKYNIKLTEDAGGHVLSVTDWMYLMDNGVIMNRSQFRKFGIKVAELVATMRPATMDEVKKAA